MVPGTDAIRQPDVKNQKTGITSPCRGVGKSNEGAQGRGDTKEDPEKQRIRKEVGFRGSFSSQSGAVGQWFATFGQIRLSNNGACAMRFNPHGI